MNEKDRVHGSYFRKVLDESQHYAQDLLEKNNELRAIVARLQVQEQHQKEQIDTLHAAAEQVRELRGRLHASEQEATVLREELAQARAEVEAHTRDEHRLQQLLSRVDDENRRYSSEFSELQQQANNLTNLYVASYSLHASLDRCQLIEATKEIVANLIGSEEIAFFTVDASGNVLTLLDANGVDPAGYQKLPLDRGLIAAAVRSGNPLVVTDVDPRGPGEETLTAVVPLRAVDQVIGAIAIFRLLPQKPAIADLDRELFDLLATQAGMAFHCADLHARHADHGPRAVVAR
jgi:hypothetical protein